MIGPERWYLSVAARRAASVTTLFCVVGLASEDLLIHRSSGRTSDRVIEVIAGSDSRFRIPSHQDPIITLIAGEEV